MHLVYVLLGGNIGDKVKIFCETTAKIEKGIGKVLARSSFYETEAWGFDSEPFLNQALLLETTLSPVDVLHEAQKIETEMGRVRKSENYEARPMDIDLLFYDNLQMETPELTLPHPRMAQRRFVLEPLAEIAADKKHPETGLTVNQMLVDCPDRLRVQRIGL